MNGASGLDGLRRTLRPAAVDFVNSAVNVSFSLPADYIPLLLTTICLLVAFITARVRSTREGNIYTWECLSVHIVGGGGAVPHLRSGGGGGGTPSQVLLGGRGLPEPRSGWGGGTPSQVLGMPPARPGMGYPPLPGPGMGYPPYLGLRWGTPPSQS